MAAQSLVEDTALKKQDLPQEFLCPITCEIMSDPHITLSGHTYEKYAIEQWLSTHNNDPLTNTKLSNKILIPNHALRKQIQSFIDKHNIKLRSNRASPFKYLLRLLRIHATQLKAMHVTSNLLQRYRHLFVHSEVVNNTDRTHYSVVIDRYLADWKMHSKNMETKWVDILANIILVKEKIYDYNALQIVSDDDSDDEDVEDVEKDTFTIHDLFEQHVVKALISTKTSLREIVSIQSNLKLSLQYFFQHTHIKAFVKEKKKQLRAVRANAHSTSSNNLGNSGNEDEEEEKRPLNEEQKLDFDHHNDDNGGVFSNDFEDDLTAFSMVAGAIIGGNACGSTGAILGSVAGPVGTMFGAAIGFYVGAIAGSTPSMLYGIYLESEKMRHREIDRLWQLIWFGFRKHYTSIDQERNEFNVCDQIIVQCMHSIIFCLDRNVHDTTHVQKKQLDSQSEEIDFIYHSVDEELVEVWQYDIARIVPILQECLSKAE